jgi:hypothetical protein
MGERSISPCLSIGLFPGQSTLAASELILVSENISSDGRHNTRTRSANNFADLVPEQRFLGFWKSLASCASEMR